VIVRPLTISMLVEPRWIRRPCAFHFVLESKGQDEKVRSELFWGEAGREGLNTVIGEAAIEYIKSWPASPRGDGLRGGECELSHRSLPIVVQNGIRRMQARKLRRMSRNNGR
jgi:hypothetical protein